MQLLKTERTIVDYMTLKDARFLAVLVNTPMWLRYIGDRNVRSVEDAQRFLQSSFLQSYIDNDFGYYLVRTTDRTPIGICGFLKKPQLENPDFGFALLPDFHGQGYANESARAVLDYGIKTFKFDVLDAVTCLYNFESKKLLNKLGFDSQGIIDATKSQQRLELYRWQFRHSNHSEPVSTKEVRPI